MQEIKTILCFLRAIYHHWALLVTGGIIAIVLLVWNEVKSPISFWPSVAILAIAVFVASYFAWKEEKQRAETAERKIAARRCLAISFNEGTRQFDEYSWKLHCRTRQFSVCIENVGAQALTNCHLIFDDISTMDGNRPRGIAITSIPFALNASEKNFVLIVSCDEDCGNRPQNAALHVPPKPKAFDEHRLISTSEAHDITLRATAAECEPSIQKFQVWLSEEQKLKMVPID